MFIKKVFIFKYIPLHLSFEYENKIIVLYLGKNEIYVLSPLIIPK